MMMNVDKDTFIFSKNVKLLSYLIELDNILFVFFIYSELNKIL